MAVISIIIPVFNAEKYLREALDSVLIQSFKDWQLILVNDGSTDTSFKICKLYAAKDSRIELVNVKNGGLSYARNRGLERANGEWVTFIDADDFVHPDFLKDMLEAADRYGNDIISAKLSSDILIAGDKVVEIESKKAIEKALYQRGSMTNSVSAKLYKRSLFDEIRFTEKLYYEDLDIFYRLWEKVPMLTFLDGEYYYYRQHSGSITHRWHSRRLDVLKVVDKLEAYMAEHRPELLPAARDRKLSANFNMYNLATKHGEQEVADSCWQVIKEYRGRDFLNPKIRFKNRVGILSSCLGRKLYTKLFL